MAVATDMDVRSKWDLQFKDFKLFYASKCEERLSRRFTFTYASPLPLIVADREFYIYEVIHYNFPQPGDISIYAKSLPDHQEFPIDSDNFFKVRGDLINNTVRLKALKDDKTGKVTSELTMITSVSANGWIPDFFANMGSMAGPKTSYRQQEQAAIAFAYPQMSV